MNDKLMIGVLGKNISGKSHTWNTLFGKPVKTGKNLRRLYLGDGQEYVDIFLISQSPSKRKINIERIVKNNQPQIVLCSLQYAKPVIKTIKYFIDNKYFLFIHWLNPGYNDPNDKPLFYEFDVLDYILSFDSIVGVRNGKVDCTNRVEELKSYIYGWAKSRDLLMQVKRKALKIKEDESGT